MAKRFKIGLALGGGAARAFSHIGVLTALHRHGIAIDVVSGTSMGAIIGAIYATHQDVEALRERFDNYLNSEVFADSGFDFFKQLDSEGDGLLFELSRLARRGLFNTLLVTQTALVKDETAARSYAYLLDDLRIEHLQIPFAAVALDLQSGRQVDLVEGSVRKAIAASCAMPGVLNPVKLAGGLLCDGGWAEAVPVGAARRLGADFVIAVDVGSSPRAFETPRNAIDVIGRADALVRCSLADEQLKHADFILTPRNGVAHWADFSTADEAIARGDEEIERQIAALRKAIRRAKCCRWFPWLRA